MTDIMENINLTEDGSLEGVAVDSGNIVKYLTFISDELHFGVSTDSVVEIITNQSIRSFPMVPDYVRGVINLRGQVIPIIDLRLRVGKMYQEDTAETCIIVLEIESDTIGIVVDSVAHVMDVDLDKIAPIPTENRQELTKYMIATDDGTVIMLLECEALVENNQFM